LNCAPKADSRRDWSACSEERARDRGISAKTKDRGFVVRARSVYFVADVSLSLPARLPPVLFLGGSEKGSAGGVRGAQQDDCPFASPHPFYKCSDHSRGGFGEGKLIRENRVLGSPDTDLRFNEIVGRLISLLRAGSAARGTLRGYRLYLVKIALAGLIILKPGFIYSGQTSSLILHAPLFYRLLLRMIF